MTAHAILQYLRYRWRAQGLHGTHSPFVYGFVGAVLRRKEGTLENRILAYTGATRFLSEEEVAHASPQDVIAVRHPHQSRARTAHWDALRARPEVRLSVDFYVIGLLFFREEFKAKQHFVLR